ncbi:MAG TPA: HD domain-containing protein [Gemmataceae bacterium]|nr:HD domain-containing protein [Gemmataceae bacterium]
MQATATATRRSVQQLQDGDTLDDVFLVADKQLRANRQGNFYLQLELRDRTGSISARMWNATEFHFKSFEAGEFLRIKGKVQLYQGSLQILFTGFDRVSRDQVELGEFLPQSEKDPGRLFERLRTLLKMENPHLRALVECFFLDEPLMAALCQAPAGVRNHHAYLGGLLEHVVSMMEVADRILPLYPDLDRDLLLLGVFLHDIGKVRELSYQNVFGYTDEGQLLGHLNIGVEILDEKIRQVPELTGEPFPRELTLRLKHLILSHHGTHEHGSPRLPMTPEAVALHLIDNLDAKVHSVVREIREDRQGTGSWTPYNPSTQRRLFKGMAAASETVEAGDQ